jgi:hypothetical protein
LGMTLDTKLRWKPHVKKNRKNSIWNTEKWIGYWVVIRPYQYTISSCCTNRSSSSKLKTTNPLKE